MSKEEAGAERLPTTTFIYKNNGIIRVSYTTALNFTTTTTRNLLHLDGMVGLAARPLEMSAASPEKVEYLLVNSYGQFDIL
jgi:hypothetical protein